MLTSVALFFFSPAAAAGTEVHLLVGTHHHTKKIWSWFFIYGIFKYYFRPVAGVVPVVVWKFECGFECVLVFFV